MQNYRTRMEKIKTTQNKVVMAKLKICATIEAHNSEDPTLRNCSKQPKTNNNAHEREKDLPYNYKSLKRHYSTLLRSTDSNNQGYKRKLDQTHQQRNVKES